MKTLRHQRILHLDGDAYFASCEVALDPKLRGQPVFVGGGRRGDGIVIAANYQAKRYGITTGMACFEAKRRCPDGVLVKPHYDEYRRLSLEMFRRARRYTPLLVPTSIDEGFLDFTDMPDVFRCANAGELVGKMKRELAEEVGIPVSAGLASSRWLAKLATESCKPDGFYEVKEGEERAFLKDVPVQKLVGIAERRARSLRAIGVWTIGDVALLPLEILRRRFGVFGEELWLLSRGELRERLSLSNKPRTCIGSATTLPYDEPDYDAALLFLLDQTERVITTFVRENLKAHEMGVYLRFKERDGAGLGVRFAGAQFEPRVINAEVERIFWQLVAGRTEPIRQVCVNFWNMEPLNLEPDLFGYNQDFKRRELHHALESIEHQFGKGSVKTGTRLLLESEASHLVGDKPKCPFIPQREMELKMAELDLPRTWGRSTSRAVKFA
ncbi:MAG: DNA polymerase IV [Verrucomicrobia bacterium]|nr:DNA polymerase IV [Verrucomicrobiota bacterium]